MGEYLIEPYEISVWEDELVTQDGHSYYKENKIAVIGSDTMTGMNKVINPIFNKKSNGEKTLSFSLRYKYFDPYSGNEEVINPFAAYLINERKVKLFYRNKWYDFIIKDHTESSEEYVWDYSLVDASILELSKTGYNIEFSDELNNNQGTAQELVKKTLEGTDWRLDESSEIGPQKISEPIYKAVLKITDGIINVDTGAPATLATNTNIYLFYSYVSNKKGSFVQFILQSNEPYITDDNNTILATNYRFNDELSYDEESHNFMKGEQVAIEVQKIETAYQAYRLVYNQITTYDPVMGKTVKKYKLDDEEIYEFTDDQYVTSNVVLNYIANGDNFNLYEDGSLQGWDNHTEHTGADFPKIELVTNPEIDSHKPLATLSELSKIEGFLKVTFDGPFNDYKNSIFNSGFEYNGSVIDNISSGQKFVFRWRAGVGSDIANLQADDSLQAIVATYPDPERGEQGYTTHKIDTDGIVLRFLGTPTVVNNIIEGGEFDSDKTKYIIDDVVQTPSVKYIYKSSEGEYVWNGTLQKYEPKTSSNYLDYYYLVAEAQRPISNEQLTDPSLNLGIFIYTTSNNQVHYIQDIQITKFVPDTDGAPIIIGNIPKAISNETKYYYLRPKEGTAAESVETYTSLKALADSLHIQESQIVPVYNENSDKVLSISESQSNCFNILQSIAETFECWIELIVEHEENGAIKIVDGIPQKFVKLNEYAGKENFAGFKYSINIDSIERNINSEEIVTKLIVDSAQSDYSDNGNISIQYADANPSGESYILNFDYYIKQGLVSNKEQLLEDKTNFETELDGLNQRLSELETERNNLEGALVELSSKRNVFTELIDTAADNRNKALDEFNQLVGESYDSYQSKHTQMEFDKRLTENDTIFDVIGTIYTTSAIRTNYAGILTNINENYKAKRHQLNGNEEFYITVVVLIDALGTRHVQVTVSDYLAPLSFQIDGNTYTVTVSKSYFDIETDANSITFIPGEGYQLNAENTQQIIDDKVSKYTLSPINTADKGIVGQIDEIIEQKKQITNSFFNKYSRFIQEGTWSSTDYIDSNLYYLDALQVSHTSAQPKVSYTINVVEISKLDGYEGYTFDAGEKTYIEDTEFFGWANKKGILTPAREEVIISEVEWHLDEPDKNVITVQNYKTRFEDLFQRIGATVQTVQYNEATYAKTNSIVNPDGTINQNVLLDSLNRISGKRYNLTTDGSVIIDGDSVLIRNLTNSANLVKINSEGIRISDDGGVSWATAISGQGINIGEVLAGSINTDKIIIGNNEKPSFRWDKAGISAYRTPDGEAYDLQTFVRYDQYGLYGIKNNGSFVASSLEDVKDKAHFAVTWDGFFIKNSYVGGGRVSLTSDNDFQIINKVNGTEREKIKIGALEWIDDGGNVTTTPLLDRAPSKYGIRINNNAGSTVFKTGDDGNLEITGTINATGGNFSDLVTVGYTDNQKPYIIINGAQSLLKSSNYQDGAGNGWLIDSTGNAYFNNITARGAIKTAVFEYAEIQAVGGVFLFRPSSTIRSAAVSGNNLILAVEKPTVFTIGQWCKISNYISNGVVEDSTINNILQTNGLTHVYRISAKSANGQLTLEGAAALLTAIGKTADVLIGGALVDMGNKTNGNGKVGTNNYGIGVNSSDNTVDLPRRAISLFETIVDETQEPKVTYNYRGILGTLPTLATTEVNSLYNNYMANTQGIYTDNMYIGNKDQYIAFYSDNTGKHLKISARDIVYEIAPDGSETTWEDKIAEATADSIEVIVTSSNGDKFLNGNVATRLTCQVIQGGANDVTSNYNQFTWKKFNKDGTEITSWQKVTSVPYIDIAHADVDTKATFVCEVEIEGGDSNDS